MTQVRLPRAHGAELSTLRLWCRLAVALVAGCWPLGCHFVQWVKA